MRQGFIDRSQILRKFYPIRMSETYLSFTYRISSFNLFILPIWTNWRVAKGWNRSRICLHHEKENRRWIPSVIRLVHSLLLQSVTYNILSYNLCTFLIFQSVSYNILSYQVSPFFVIVRNNKVLDKSAIKKGGHFSRGRPFKKVSQTFIEGQSW